MFFQYLLLFFKFSLIVSILRPPHLTFQSIQILCSSCLALVFFVSYNRWMQQPRFRPKRIPEFSRKLVIGFSRTKYIDPRTVGSTIHSFRGPTLVDLHDTLKLYKSKKLETVIAGFNDYRANCHEIACRSHRLIEIFVTKFKITNLRIPKPIGNWKNSHINI